MRGSEKLQIYVAVDFSSLVIFVFLLFLGKLVMYPNEAETKGK